MTRELVTSRLVLQVISERRELRGPWIMESAELSAYELERCRNIEANRRKLAEIGLLGPDMQLREPRAVRQQKPRLVCDMNVPR